MKRVFFAIALISAVFVSCKPKVETTVTEPSWYVNEAYFNEKNGMYEEMPVYPTNIVMVGDDYIDRGVWNEMYGDTTLKNRGITYDATEHVLSRIAGIAAGHPAKIFVSVGANDIEHEENPGDVAERIDMIFAKIKEISPETGCYWINIVNLFDDPVKAANAKEVNSTVAVNCIKGGYACIDLDAKLNAGIRSGEYSWDNGKHLNGKGYEAYAQALDPFMEKKHFNKAVDTEYADPINDYYRHRTSLFLSLPRHKHKIVMLGNSLNNNALWAELFPLGLVINRGISGDVITGVDQRLDEVASLEPNKIFLMTGSNDFFNDGNVTVSEVWGRYEKLIKDIKAKMPETILYVQSMLPVNPMTSFYDGFNAKAAELNKLLEAGQEKHEYIYLDVATNLTDENGDLKASCTTDGIHLSAEGYFVWATILAQGSRMMVLQNPFKQ